MTKEDILAIIKKENVKFIKLQFTDMLGMLKTIEIPSTNLNKALNNEVIFDGSSVTGFAKIDDADMYLYPDIDTWLILELESTDNYKVGRFLCDVYTSKKEQFESDPRSILKNCINIMREMNIGHNFNVGLEPEFFLFQLNEDKMPTLKHTDFSSYFDTPSLDFNYKVRREIMFELQKLGFKMEVSHHEVSKSQHEVNFEYSNAVDTCDKLQTFKVLVKTIAKKYNMYATFMPKPIKDVNGSGMHVNCSISDINNNNLFYDESMPNGLSQLAIYFINGVLKNAREISLLTNSTINSFKRLVPGFEAPCYIAWSDSNRSTMIRIPAANKQAKRVEVRSVDSSCNPYLGLSAILMAGIDGIKNKLTDFQSIKRNLFKMDNIERKALNIDNLPHDLQEAIECFKKSDFIRSFIGNDLHSKFISIKEKEWLDYSTEVTDWEIKNYLKTY
ncbi:type I glutamate--ammonia ligase [Spiroplasma turonicum]|uniref:Glutamine synthetase n=1 Tax=Spiroplasma turonicum TaxID=216946 RepID=A0A0K1P6S8_9MOLU|nr:type I glutamate--ammonia ligase [Spiroplasma turonicum]AKU80011.1 glutamine synthetase [Spiroplasma turonicum]ALX71013.1 glutamine synthetase [Spiroplasma turonicum]